MIASHVHTLSHKYSLVCASNRSKYSGAWLQSNRLVDNVSANKNQTFEKHTQNENRLREKAPTVDS